MSIFLFESFKTYVLTHFCDDFLAMLLTFGAVSLSLFLFTGGDACE